MVLSGGPKERAEAPRVVPEAIGPRSILEGLDKLQDVHFQGQKAYANDLPKLVADLAKDEKVFSPAWKAAVSEELTKTNLVIRTLPDGFELALRQGEKRWLVYSRFGGSAPKISTLETDGAPPFGGPEAAAEKSASAVPAVQVDLEEYKEPQDYFSLMLPKGFEVSRHGSGSVVRVSFSYTNAVRLAIKAMEINRGWEPLTELSAKAEQIKSGNVPAFADFHLAITNLLDVEGGTGYEMGLVGVRSKAGMYTHTFALGGERTLLSVAAVCPAQSGKELYESILASVRDTLRIGLGPQEKKTVVSADKGAKAAPAGDSAQQPLGPPPLTPEEEKQWAEARGLLKTAGIMRSGDTRVAIVNGQVVRIGDTVLVRIKDKPFQFAVKAISEDDVQFERVLNKGPAGSADKQNVSF